MDQGIPPIAYLGILIPILALSIPLLGIGTYFYKQWLEFKKEAIRIQASASANLNQAQLTAIESIRQEMAQFRDTVTQYDMSVEKTLSEIKSRVDHLESGRLERSYGDYKPISDVSQPAIQQVGDGK